MSDRTKLLLEQVRALPDDEREELLGELWEEYEDGPPDPYPDEEAWRAELDRRIASIDDGTAELIPWDEAMAQVRAELARRRAAREGKPSP